MQKISHPPRPRLRGTGPRSRGGFLRKQEAKLKLKNLEIFESIEIVGLYLYIKLCEWVVTHFA